LQLLVLSDFSDELEEAGLVVELELGRGLEEGAAPLLGELGALGVVDLALVLEVGLVADEDHGDLISVLGAEDLVVEDGDLLERGLGGDVVDEEEALAVAHPLVLHGGELLLAGGVENVEQSGFIVDDDLLAVRVLDGGVWTWRKEKKDEVSRGWSKNKKKKKLNN